MSRSVRLSLWLKYRWFLDTPGGSTGLSKILGIALYVACLLFAVLLLLLMFQGETPTYIKSFSSESSTFRKPVLHRFPDIIMCPSKLTSGPPTIFNVWYARNTIENMKIRSDEVDAITKFYYNSCSDDLEKNCEAMLSPCPSEMTSICDRIEKTLRKVMKNIAGYKAVNIWARKRIDLAFKTLEKLGMTPLVLWLLVTQIKYPTYWRYSKSIHNVSKYEMPRFHFYKDGKADQDMSDKAYDQWHNVWLENTLCFVIRGSKLTLVETPFFGITYQGPDRFWLGNLETMKVSDRSLTNIKFPNLQKRSLKLQERASSIVYYAMTRLEEPHETSDCIEQPFLKGIPKTCSDENARWYYDLSFNTDRSLTSVWIYPASVTRIVKGKTYNLYTQVEIAVGLFGTCVGMSIFQAIELWFGAMQGRFREIPLGHKISTGLKWLLYIIVTISASIVTGIDTSSYFGNSISNESRTEPEENYTIPIIRICSEQHHSYSFWNNTKFHEFNVSVETAAFIRSFAWFKKFAEDTHYNYELPGNSVIYPNYQIKGLNLERIRAKNISIKETGNWTAFSPCMDHVEGMEANSQEESCIQILLSISNPMLGSIDTTWYWNKYWVVEYKKVFKKFLGLNKTNELERKLFSFGKNLNKSRYTEFSRRILHQLSHISRQNGKGSENPYLVDIAQAFVPDPLVFLKCYANGVEIKSCGSQFEVNMLNRGHKDDRGGKIGFCLILKSKETFRRSLGLSNGLELVFDSEFFKQHSDAVEYYGPGTLEETIQHFPKGACVEETQMCAKEFSSFQLELTHPTGGFSSETLRLDKMGLFGKNSIAVNLRASFTKLLDWNNDCVPRNELLCKHPAEDLNEVYLAIQMKIFCNCAYCLHHGKNFIQHLKYVMGESVQCCTVKSMLDCYFQYARDIPIKADGSYDKESQPFQVLPFWLGRYQGPIESWRNIFNETMVDSIFKWPYNDKSRLTSKEKQRIVEFCNRCTKPRCEETSLKVSSVQSIPSRDYGKKDSILFFYGHPDSGGVEEVYRLDPALLLGAISCAYSFTFGIGVVGVLEFVVSFIHSLFRGDKSLSQNIVYQHIIRSFTVWLAPSPSTHPESDQRASSEIQSMIS